MPTALNNLLKLKKPNGLLFITVPIEIGLVGLSRVIWRNLRYGYNTNICFKEFGSHKNLLLSYVTALLKNGRISKFRQPKEHWSTHFGFDYRDIDDYFKAKQIDFRAENKTMTRFYIVK